MNNSNSREAGDGTDSWRVIILTAGIAWAFFNLLLNYGYILSLIESLLHINGDVAIGVTVFILSIIVTVLGFLIALLVSSTVYKTNSRHASLRSMIKTAIVFSVLQVFVAAVLLSAHGTLSSEILTITQLVGSLMAGFLSWPLFSWILNMYSNRMSPHLKLVWINILSILIAIPLIYTTISLAYESYSLSSSPLALALWYSYYAIAALVVLTILVSQIRESKRWAVAGLVIPMLPLALFYFVGFFQF